MSTKQEIMSLLTALTDDYSELISACNKANCLYFSESVPQPSLLKKNDGSHFNESDCEKIISGDYTLNEHNLADAVPSNSKVSGKAIDDCIELTYADTVKKAHFYQPAKNEPIRPTEPKYEEFKIKPAFMAVSAISFILFIVGIVLVVVLTSLPSVAYAVVVVGIVGMILGCVKSMGGIFTLIPQLLHIRKKKNEYDSAMCKYKRDLTEYEQKCEAAQIEYDKAQIVYQQQISDAEKEYKANCRKLYESVVAEIPEYIAACKDYFAHKSKFEKEKVKKLADIKASYNTAASKIKTYPDIIPVRFLKVPEFDNASCLDLCENHNELRTYVEYLENGRADNIKEAANCYVADKQAEEQRRILEQQAEEARERERERNRILAEQAEEQRRYNAEQMRFNEQQAEEQRRFNERQAEEQRRLNEQQAQQTRREEEQRRLSDQQAARQQARQAEEQRKLLQRQACSTGQCPYCRVQCGMVSYSPDTSGRCLLFSKK